MQTTVKLFTFLCLIFTIIGSKNSKGQVSSKIAHSPNYIDSITTTDEILLLIGKLDSKYKNFTPLSKISDLSAFCNNNLSSYHLKDWTKVDFDHNGLTDIIIVGKSNAVRAICILDLGESFQLEPLSFGYSECIGVDVVKDKVRCRILDSRKKAATTTVMPDTRYLVYKYGGFIIENTLPAAHRIEKITYSTTMCYGTCPIFEISIDNKRNATFNAIKDNIIDQQTISGNYHTVITELKYKQLNDLLNYINFEKLDAAYTPNLKDAQRATLTITYNNGKVKTITDTGLKGNHSLMLVHRLLFDLRKNQEWIN